MSSQERVENSVLSELVSFAESAASFSPPFDIFERSGGGFDAVSRFLIDCARRGDADARGALRNTALATRSRLLGEPFEKNGATESDVIVARRDEFLEFRRDRFPWEDLISASQLRVVDPGTTPVAHVAGLMSETIGPMGFRPLTSRSGRRVIFGGQFFGYTLGVCAELIDVPQSLDLSFSLKELRIELPLGFPFCFSGSTVFFGRVGELTLPARQILSSWAHVLPGMTQAVERALRS